MRALLLVGGEAPPRERVAPLFATADLVCAADSGLDLAHSWGLSPGLIVGDMDSLSEPGLLSAFPDAQIHRLERAKDESDTEAGLALCRDRGADDIVIVGGGGGRLDHLLAIRALFERPLRPSAWHLAMDSVFLVTSGSFLSFEAEAGGLVSVFPLAGGSRAMTSKGLRWDLAGLDWSAGYYGLSNETLGGSVTIAAGEGDLLVIRTWRDSRPLQD
jgi:thiamine pyrophosphokinase